MKIIKGIIGNFFIVALLLLGSGGLVLVSDNTALAASGETGEFNIVSGAESAHDGKTPESLVDGENNIFKSVANVLLYIIGGISVIMLIYGGIRYTTSGGNSTNVTAAKNTIMYSIIGLVIAILAYALVNFILAWFMD